MNLSLSSQSDAIIHQSFFEKTRWFLFDKIHATSKYFYFSLSTSFILSRMCIHIETMAILSSVRDYIYKLTSCCIQTKNSEIASIQKGPNLRRAFTRRKLKCFSEINKDHMCVGIMHRVDSRGFTSRQRVSFHPSLGTIHEEDLFHFRMFWCIQTIFNFNSK